MNPYTCIGHWDSEPDQPLIHQVTSEDIPGAIDAARRQAHEYLGAAMTDHYQNTYVIAGHPEILSTWAG
jgi:hypothetical protein